MSRKTPAAVLVAILLAAIFVAFTPASEASFHGNFGSYVSSVSDKDFVPHLTDPAAGRVCFGYIDDPNSADFNKRAYVMHIEPTTDCASATKPASGKTWLFTQFGGTTANRWLTSGDTTYTTQDFTAIQQVSGASNFLCRQESDGISGYSLGDIVYIKNGLTTTASLQEHDLRIGPSVSGVTDFSASFGFVKTTDQDLQRGTQAEGGTADPTRLPVGTTLDCGGFSVKMLTLGQVGVVSNQNVFYLAHTDMAITNTVVPGMVRLTSTSDVTGAGTKVLSANSDNKRILEVLTPGDVQIASTAVISGANEVPNRGVVLHTADPTGNDDHVRMHDVFIKKGTGTTASSPGTLVTATSSSSQAGARSDIDGATLANLEARVFFFDKNGNGLPDENDHVYIKHPSNTLASSGGSCTSGVGTLCLAEHDIRVSVPSVSGATAGSLVKPGDGDWVNRNSAGITGDFVLKIFSEKDDTRSPLKAVTEGKYHDADGDNVWDPTSEDVWLSSGSTVANGTVRVWANQTGPVWDPITCPDPACGDALKSGKVKSTGPDGTYRTVGHGFNERIYWSDDNFVGVGDRRLGDVTVAGNTVAEGDADVAPGSRFQSSGVTLYISWDTSGTFNFPTANDIQLYPSFGTRLTSSSTGVVPKVATVTPDLVRADLGDSGLQDDGYYLDFSSGSNFQSGRVLRMTPAQGNAAGGFVQSGDTVELQTGQASALRATNAQTHFGFIDAGTTGFGTSDFVYLDLPNALGGSAGGTLTQWDSRVSAVSLGSAAAGSRVMTGDTDHQTYGGDTLDELGNAEILWWDANGDTIVNQHDALWLRLRQDLAAAAAPTFLDIRLNGPAGSTGGTGGTTPPPTTPSGPSLSNGRVTPEFVEVGHGQTFQVTYSHGGNTAPTTRNVVIDGESYTMQTSDTTYSDGSLYTVSRTMNTAGEFDVHFEFTSGSTTVRFPSSGSLTAYVGPAENEAPTLSDATVSPSEGDAGEEFSFRVTYKDANNDAPVDPKLHLNVGGTSQEQDLTCQGSDYYAGVSCVATVAIAETGTFGYHFTASDGEEEARSPASGTHSGPTVGDEPQATGSPGPTPDQTGSPSPSPTEDGDTPGPAVVLILAALGALLVVVRRRER